MTGLAKWVGNGARPSIFLALVLTSPAAAETTAPASDLPPAPSQEAVADRESDPFESVNRKIFWFNDKLDTYVLEPAAKGWDFVMPHRVETCVSNFFYNLRFPIETLNDLLQGKPKYAASDVGRFLVNTTVGIAGFFDPATSLGMELHWEDFGQTLGWWGVGTGPYLMLPILGPSDLRDGGALIVDTASSITPFFVSSYYTVGARAVDIVNTRAVYADTIRRAKESSFDYYSFVRNAYLQRREGLINDQAPGREKNQDELYHPEGD